MSTDRTNEWLYKRLARLNMAWRQLGGTGALNLDKDVAGWRLELDGHISIGPRQRSRAEITKLIDFGEDLLTRLHARLNAPPPETPPSDVPPRPAEPDDANPVEGIADLAQLYGVTTDQLARAIYKATSCGAWFHPDRRPGVAEPAGVRVGSIVEGSEAEFSFALPFPFTYGEWRDRIHELEWRVEQAAREAEAEADDLADDAARSE